MLLQLVLEDLIALLDELRDLFALGLELLVLVRLLGPQPALLLDVRLDLLDLVLEAVDQVLFLLGLELDGLMSGVRGSVLLGCSPRVCR